MQVTVIDDSMATQSKKTTQAPRQKSSKNSRSSGFKVNSQYRGDPTNSMGKVPKKNDQGARQTVSTAKEPAAPAEEVVEKKVASAEEILNSMGMNTTADAPADEVKQVAMSVEDDEPVAPVTMDEPTNTPSSYDDEEPAEEEVTATPRRRGRVNSVVDDGPNDDEEEEDEDDDDFRPGKTIGREASITTPRESEKRAQPAKQQRKAPPKRQPVKQEPKRRPAPAPVKDEDDDEEEELISRPSNDRPGRPQVIVKQESFLSQLVVLIEVAVGAGLAFFGGTQIASIIIQRIIKG